MFTSALPQGALTISGKQNLLFRSGEEGRQGGHSLCITRRSREVDGVGYN